MARDSVIAAGVEKMGLRTFSTVAIGFNLSAPIHPGMVDRAADSPVFVDFSGDMAQVSDPKDHVDAIRASITDRSKLQASVHC